MKNVTIFAIIILLLAVILIYLKPSELKSDSQDATVSSLKQDITSEQIPNTQSSQVTQPQQQPDIEAVNPQSEEPLFDTKSDFSIQPIDPATDPGNQIVTPN